MAPRPAAPKKVKTRARTALKLLRSRVSRARLDSVRKPPRGSAFDRSKSHFQPAAGELQAFRKIRRDPVPKKLALDKHFLISNEIHHELFRRSIKGLGGIYLGVGTDQNYVLAGWSRPDYLIMMDFDQWVVDLHKVYFLIFEHAATPKAFLALWSPAQKGKLLKLINARYGKKSWPIRLVLSRSHRQVYRRLKKIQERYAQLEVPIFLTDQRQYDLIRKLIRAQRAIAVRGNLLGHRTMRSIGRFSRKYKRVVRTFYISNAEEYAKYHFPFKRNIRALNMDDRSLLLRTLPFGGIQTRYWTYYTQRLKDFRIWMNKSRLLWVRTLVGWGRKKHDGFMHLTHMPKRYRARRAKAKKKK